MIETTNNKTLYTIEDYVYAYYFFESLGIGYKKYDILRKNLNNDHRYPSKSSINRFKLKMVKYKICENIYNNYKTINDLNTSIISIDSTFIANKSANKKETFIGSNPFYKSKKGSRLTALVNENGIPLYISINSANKNDATLGVKLIKNIKKEELENKTLLGDSGYDSSKFKQLLNNKKCEYIIPLNKKATFPDEIKNKKLNIKNNIKLEKQKVWKTITNIKNTSNNKNEIRNVKRNIKILDKQQKDAINNINDNYRKSVKRQKREAKKANKKIIYKLNIPVKDKPIYKKRIKIEHFFSKLKACRLIRIYDKKINTFRESIFSRIIDIFICINDDK